MIIFLISLAHYVVTVKRINLKPEVMFIKKAIIYFIDVTIAVQAPQLVI
jgi:hypothetical protein